MTMQNDKRRANTFYQEWKQSKASARGRSVNMCGTKASYNVYLSLPFAFAHLLSSEIGSPIVLVLSRAI